MQNDLYQTRSSLRVGNNSYSFYSLEKLQTAGIGNIDRLPYSIRIMLEAVLRRYNQIQVTSQNIIDLVTWQPISDERKSIPFYPGRVIMQDLSGVPVLVDLAALRNTVARLNGKPEIVNPCVPVDIVIDHSLHVDYYGTSDAYKLNSDIEFKRNLERYEFLHWSQKAFNNLRIIPPSVGIVHQINLEYLTPGVMIKHEDGTMLAFPDSVVGTDSHTTMINGLGILGWGVGGIEAITVMLDQPIEILIPDVIGVKLMGKLPDGSTPTDLTLTITQILRKYNVVGKFVEFFGSGLNSIPLTDRAMIANMAPEYGATIAYFPIDNHTIDYMHLSGRPIHTIDLFEAYHKAQHLYRNENTPDPEFSQTIEINLADIEPSVAGPKRPQDRIPLNQVKNEFRKALTTPKNQRGFGLSEDQVSISGQIELKQGTQSIKHGAVIIAAITSCTNTSNPYVMIGAGILAKKAVEKGLRVKPYVKTSLAPGSRVVAEYLKQSGLLKYLEKLGFFIVGFGCTTCIGNSGAIPKNISDTITNSGLVSAAVLSGNRNFEGRVSPYTLANYLASPPLVIAYALAGTVDIDFENESLGEDKFRNPIYLRDIFPTPSEIEEYIQKYIQRDIFLDNYADVFKSNPTWNKIQSVDSNLFKWDPSSTYLQEPPYFLADIHASSIGKNIIGARVLAVLGDSITTDHISPAGEIPLDSPAGKYLIEHGVTKDNFNTYGSRRGNDQVLTRATFSNIRLKNQLAQGIEGGFTHYLPDDQLMTIYDAALRYQQDHIPLIILAGKEYGTGSSRDWAAKGALLLGVKAIIAESYERIHRSNLIGMGILPLQFKPNESIKALNLTGKELFYIDGLDQIRMPNEEITVKALTGNHETSFRVISRLDTPIELTYLRNGGVFPTILRNYSID